MHAAPPAYPDEVAVAPVRAPVDADVVVPGSKSDTNRALPIAALADGTSVIRGALFSDDTHYMAAALNALGIGVEATAADDTFTVTGAGGRLPARAASLFVGNSGTTARFLTALLALGHGEYLVDGVARMRQRPIQPLLDALQQLGVDAVSLSGTGCPPVRVRARSLRGGQTRLDGRESSQFLSALLMIGPCTPDGLVIEIDGDLVSKPYVDLTRATMAAFGARLEHDGYRRFVVPGGQTYRATDYRVEPDASAASYFFALAAATGGRVRVAGLGARSVQGDLRFVEVLARMGCTVTMTDAATEVQGPRALCGVEVDMNGISDTAQTLAAIAPLATGPVAIRNVAHIRAKETDRISAVVTELRRLGVRVEELPDGLVVHPSPVRPGRVETYDDHRMAMSFAVLGCAVPGIRIANPGCVAKTFPRFWETLERTTAAAR
ncbi:MAG: 3-phosphoshikimate 1-carboxyvinyltransferase [Sphaerobacter sp.]|nr:3-phosphoshikimate 1-carboxyvinyltransferase [Sphaerobacter sp.]